MLHLSDPQLAEYTKQFLVDQADLLRSVRTIILKQDPLVTEKIITGKWLTGYIGYYSPKKNFVYALGVLRSGKVTLHMMPYYGSKQLREKYASKLQPYLTGKSCISFSSLDDNLLLALKEIIENGSFKLDEAVNSVKSKK